MHILVIEDNQDLLEELCFQLRHHQHDVLGLPDGSTLAAAPLRTTANSTTGISANNTTFAFNVRRIMPILAQR